MKENLERHQEKTEEIERKKISTNKIKITQIQ